MKKIIIILGTILVFGGVGFLAVKQDSPLEKDETVNYGDIYDVGDLPLMIDQLPLSYQLEEVEGQKVLNISYKNNSKEAIMNFSLNLKLKSNQESINVKFSELLQPGEESTVSTINVPTDTNIDDIVAEKYMISLQKGVYMEYDSSSNQYNWS